MSFTFISTILSKAGRIPSTMTAEEFAQVYKSILSSLSALKPHNVRMRKSRPLPSAMTTSEYARIFEALVSSLSGLKPHNVRSPDLRREPFLVPFRSRLKRRRVDDDISDPSMNIARVKKVPCKRLAGNLPWNMDIDDAIWIRLDQSVLAYWLSLVK